MICFVFISASQEIGIWGGKDNKQFLGLINVNEYNIESIWNSSGEFGSEYRINSIWNTSGTYGSIYNMYSPWCTSSSIPPKLLDKQGNFYGYFTSNKYYFQRTKIDWIVWILDNYEYVIKHRKEVYQKLF
jgi:hypothetical protein